MKNNENELIQLENIGLSKDEAVIYMTMLTHGGLPASTIGRLANVSRVMTYRVLNELINKNLAKRVDKNAAISQFYPQHPFGLVRLIDKRREEVNFAAKTIESVAAKLSTDYARVMGEPGVRVFVGVSGFIEALKDIEKEAKTLRLIRTPRDSDSKEILENIRSHIKRRAMNGIETKVIAPLLSTYDSDTFEWDKENLVERRFVPEEELLTEGQVSIYGDKVAIVSYKETGPVTTLIHDVAISKTFLYMFDYIWKYSQEFTQKAFEELKARPMKRGHRQ